ncbi:MAG: SDR family NAD(P)-dependent oxidoreductase [Anaerolineae bacterium]
MFRLDGKVALVTGAGSGLGAGIAVALARQGADVAICGRGNNGLEQTAAQVASYGRRVYPFTMDVRDLGQLERGVGAVVRELGPVDILVNNAGINRPQPALEITEDAWDDLYATNVKGGFFLAQKVAPMMIERGWGRIIWVSSQSGLVAIPGQATYCSSKGAVVQLVRTLGVEWAKHGITVNSVAPTFVETNINRVRLQNPEFRRAVLEKIPKGELGTVEDVAAAVVYLASEEAGMVNGHNLPVDGGWTVW